jgi:hypothetical protein
MINVSQEGTVMAKVWAVYEGREPTVGGPWAILPLQTAVDIFELHPDDYVSDLASKPRFGDANRDLTHVGFKHIIVQVERNEGHRLRWKPGFYKSRVTPEDAFTKLIKESIVDELGNENVVRVEHEPTTDSRGRDALKITVVIAPGATQRLRNGAVLNALVKLQSRLREMREDRIPIVEYATEAELLQDGGP